MRVYDSATVICAKKKITFIPENAPAPDAPEADAFGTGIFH